jgi:hypothetical protein
MFITYNFHLAAIADTGLTFDRDTEIKTSVEISSMIETSIRKRTPPNIAAILSNGAKAANGLS